MNWEGKIFSIYQIIETHAIPRLKASNSISMFGVCPWYQLALFFPHWLKVRTKLVVDDVKWIRNSYWLIKPRDVESVIASCCVGCFWPGCTGSNNPPLQFHTAWKKEVSTSYVDTLLSAYLTREKKRKFFLERKNRRSQDNSSSSRRGRTKL